ESGGVSVDVVTAVTNDYPRLGRLHIRPVGVDDLPRAIEPLIHLGRIPSRRRLRAITQLCSVVNQIEGKYGYVPALLYLRVNHLDTFDFDLSGERGDVPPQRILAVDALVGHRIE